MTALAHNRLALCLAAGIIVAIATSGLGACAPGERDVERFASEEGGAEKLAAIVKDDGANSDVRRGAALALARYERRSRRIGLDVLVAAMREMPAASRANVVTGIAPDLVKGTTLPRPASGADPATTPKDAAYALVVKNLVDNPKTKAELLAALSTWVTTSTRARMEDVTSRYSLHQVVRLLGAPALASIVAAVDGETLRDRLVDLVVAIGDDGAKATARESLVRLARHVASPAWLAEETARVQAANARAKAQITREQLDEQVARFRVEELASTFAVMTRIGALDAFLLDFATDEAHPPEARAAAIRAIAHAKLDAAGTARVIAIVRAEKVPDALLGPAFELLRGGDAAALRELYSAFASKHWPRRFGAATAIASRLQRGDVDDFMTHLAVATAPMGLAEPIAYGAALAKVAGGPRALAKYLDARSPAVKLTAIGAYWGASESARVDLARVERDAAPLPACDERGLCAWACDPLGDPATSLAAATPLATVGDFVRICIEPTLGKPNAVLPASPFDDSFAGAISRARQQHDKSLDPTGLGLGAAQSSPPKR